MYRKKEKKIRKEKKENTQFIFLKIVKMSC